LTVSPLIWAAFVAFIVAMLLVDLFLHRDHQKVTLRDAGIWSAVWVTLGLSFGVVVLFWQNGQAATEYVTGYIIEKSLSVDNIFVFAIIFSYFSVPPRYQHNLLFWGIFGALVFRAIFIFAGVALLEQFHWMVYVFGAFLVFTGIRMWFHEDEDVHPEHNPVLRLLRRVFPISKDFDGARFITVDNGRRVATPLLAILVVIETTDIVFAVDSIPAILAITQDRFLVFTSNAFAILGLRALYFLLAGIMDRFIYLNNGLSFVLAFVGAKMLLTAFDIEINTVLSLGIISVALTISIVASLKSTQPDVVKAREGGDHEAFAGGADDGPDEKSQKGELVTAGAKGNPGKTSEEGAPVGPRKKHNPGGTGNEDDPTETEPERRDGD
jgi:tellurite resistance protein TerC